MGRPKADGSKSQVSNTGLGRKTNLQTDLRSYRDLKISRVLNRFKIIIISISGVIWSLTLREERRLRVFENRVLSRVFGARRDKVTGVEKIT